MTTDKAEHKRNLARERKRRQRDREKQTSPDLTLLRPGVKAPTADPVISSSPQITTGSPQGQMTGAFDRKELRKVDPAFYEVLREGIPLIDGAIGRLVSLNGTVKVIGDNMPLVKELEDFCLNVPVNDMQKGIHAFHQNFANETFEQGFSISEFIATADRKDIDHLRVADSKRIIFRKNAQGRYEPWYRTGEPIVSNYSLPGSIIQQILTSRYGQMVSYNGVEEIKLQPANKIYFSINNENSDPYGVSIMRSLDFVAQTLVTIQNSMKNQAERFGDPMYHVHLEAGGKVGADIEARRKGLQNDFNTVVTSKRSGKSADLVTAGGPNSKVTVQVIGHDGQILTFEIQTRHLLEQIISKTHLPAWMLGIYWSTTERMATLEIEAALADARIRQYAMLPEFIRLFSAFLRLRGRSWKNVTLSPDKGGDWGLVFESPNLRDLVAQAQARFLNAQADQMSAVAGVTAAPATAGTQPGKDSRKLLVVGNDPLRLPLIKGESNTACGCNIPHIVGQKELGRPTPWPELDTVETAYEYDLKARWETLRQRVFMILGLDNQKAAGQSGLTDKRQKAPGDIPGMEDFVFDDTQRAQIMQAFNGWLGELDIDVADSVVRWYYGQAYSLGLIQAAKLIGQGRPILDIIKNKEIFDELIKSGFDLVKENATKAIVQQIMPAMQAQMLAGTNPRHVADTLEKLFGDKNSDWERLARSEMSMAAEKAKLDEWTEWGVKMVEFKPSPDACAICFSVAGDYPIGKCPLPVASTHPRCRCDIVPAKSEVDNKTLTAPSPGTVPGAAAPLQDVTKQLADLSDQVKAVSDSLPGMITDIAGRMKTEIIMPEIKFPEIKMPDINVTTPDIHVTAPDVHVTTPDITVNIENKGQSTKKTLSLQKDDKGRIISGTMQEAPDDGA